MKKLQDNQFETINNSISLSRQSKDKMKYTILNTPQKQKKYYFPRVLGIILTIFVFALSYFLLSNHYTEQSNKTDELSQGVIVDSQTPEILPNIQVSNNMFTIEWLSDSMDRGNHDLQTDIHGNLVVSKDIQLIKRGDIIYYTVNQQNHIGRVIGLAGETVKIKEGQVYIDDKKLDTFYGVATSLGLSKDEYLEKVNTDNTNIVVMEEHFNTSMEPILVEENTVFVLVDMWWRGIDSREFGLISMEKLKGIVMGYEK